MQVRLGEHMNLHGDVNSQTVTWKENHVFDDKSGTDMAFREQRHKVGAYAEVKDKNLSVSAGPEYTFDSERIEMGRVKNEQENSRLGLGLQLQLGF